MTDPQTDPRFVEDRCGEGLVRDLLVRARYRCMFRRGHAGLHFADRLSEMENYEVTAEPGEPIRWGTATQLMEEALNMGPRVVRGAHPFHIGPGADCRECGRGGDDELHRPDRWMRETR